MQLVEGGKLGLDDDISRLPAGRPAVPTLRQIFSHTSGLTREAGVGHYLDDHAPPLAETVRSLAAFPRKVAPGTYRYSNAGFALLGRGDRSADRCGLCRLSCRTSIFTPLGMTDTTVGFDDASQESARAGGDVDVRRRHGRAAVQPRRRFRRQCGLNAWRHGAIRAGAAVGRTAAAFGAEEMWHVPAVSAAMALALPSTASMAQRTVGHGGVVYGFASQLTALPDDGSRRRAVRHNGHDQPGSRSAGCLRAAPGACRPGRWQADRSLRSGRGRRSAVGWPATIWRADGSDRIELRERDEGLYLIENGVPLEIRVNGGILVARWSLAGRGHRWRISDARRYPRWASGGVASPGLLTHLR